MVWIWYWSGVAVDGRSHDGLNRRRERAGDETQETLAIEKRFKLPLPKDVVLVCEFYRNGVGDL